MRTVFVGTSSWTDKTLLDAGTFYPRRSMSAKERLRFYTTVFPLVEADATFYFPPTPEMTSLWAERTPAGFRMNVKAYGLFTQHGVRRESLWPDVLAHVPPGDSGRGRVYLSHLAPRVADLAWARFGAALEPLRNAGRLGAVLFQFPPWFRPSRAAHAHLEELGGRLPGCRVAVEFRHGDWMRDDRAARTLDRLEELGFTYVCVDEPQGFASSVPPVVAATADLAMVRFHGRNTGTWEAKDLSAAERFAYLYDDEELGGWVPRLHELASSAAETHVLMNNCYGDYAARNARRLMTLLDADAAPPRLSLT